jgi:hypothetical protein
MEARGRLASLCFKGEEVIKLLGVENSEKQAIPPLKDFFLSFFRYTFF